MVVMLLGCAFFARDHGRAARQLELSPHLTSLHLTSPRLNESCFNEPSRTEPKNMFLLRCKHLA